MNIVPHHHHSCEAASSKIQRFFAEFHVGQILRSCNAYKLRGFAVMHLPRRVRGGVPAAFLLPTKEGCARVHPV